MKITIELDSLHEAEQFGFVLNKGPRITFAEATGPSAVIEVESPSAPATTETPVKADAETMAEAPAVEADQPKAEAPAVEPEKPRRGRPKKEKAEAEAPKDEAPAAEAANDGGFEVALAELEAQMKTAGKSTGDVEKAIGQWREMGPASVEKLKGLVQQNKDYLAKKNLPAQPVVPAPAPVPAPDKAPTEDQLRSAGMDYMATHDMNQLLNLLSTYGCARVVEMASKSVAEQWEFIAKCKAAPNA